MTQYLNLEKLDAIDTPQFRMRKPYPWVNPENLLTQEGYDALMQTMPDVSLFEKKFGYARRAGQTPHDRYSLEYTEDASVPEPWHDFINELRGDAYRNTMARLFNARNPEFRFHWHYAPAGCSVSPHCDAKREYGSHIFYFNANEEWDSSWGGETLILDDGGRFNTNSSPTFEDFDQAISCKSQGNVSAILERSNRGWHGVRAINCDDNQMRKIFIVVVNPRNIYWRVRDKLIGKSIQRL